MQFTLTTRREVMKENLVIDSDWSVAPVGNDKICIGYVDEVNGPGAAAVPEFVPTRAELIILFKHYYKKDLDIRFWWFCFEQAGSSDTRRQAFAARRWNRIADVLNLDEEAVQKLCREVEDVFRAQQEASGAQYAGLAWDVFMHKATPEQVAEYNAEKKAFWEGLGEGLAEPS